MIIFTLTLGNKCCAYWRTHDTRFLYKCKCNLQSAICLRCSSSSSTNQNSWKMCVTNRQLFLKLWPFIIVHNAFIPFKLMAATPTKVHRSAAKFQKCELQSLCLPAQTTLTTKRLTLVEIFQWFARQC